MAAVTLINNNNNNPHHQVKIKKSPLAGSEDHICAFVCWEGGGGKRTLYNIRCVMEGAVQWMSVYWGMFYHYFYHYFYSW